MQVRVFELIGKIGLTLDQGQQVYDAIYPALKAGEVVELDFAGVELAVGAFLNAGFGQLMSEFTPEYVEAHLQILNLEKVWHDALKRMVDSSYEYLHNPTYRAAVDHVIDELVEM